MTEALGLNIVQKPRIAEIFMEMSAYSRGNAHDIAHFSKVWAYCRILGMLEGLSACDLYRLEVIAITHDIACPVCREKYGSAWGKKQELEGPPLVREFLGQFNYPRDFIESVAFVNGHHHTYRGINRQDWQILVEADFMVNAEEGRLSAIGIRNFRKRVFRTEAGKKMLDSIFPAFA